MPRSENARSLSAASRRQPTAGRARRCCRQRPSAEGLTRPQLWVPAWAGRWVLGLALCLGACNGRDELESGGVGLPNAGRLSLVLGAEDTEGFLRATRPPEWNWPRDHGPHPGFRTEWWYWTGNLRGGAGEEFGFQLVFFRHALRPPVDPGGAGVSLDADEVVLAHAALTDVGLGRFHYGERLQRHDRLRASVSLVDDERLRLFCADWSAESEPGGDGLHPVRLRVRETGFSFDLRLDARSEVVLQGESGLSRKGRDEGNASIYYSVPRLAVRGEVTQAGVATEVSGQAWLDREWSTSALEPDQVGWDWFSLQLEDDSELMWYRLRSIDGGESPTSSGLFIAPDGSTRRLAAGDVELQPIAHWRAEDGAARYPVRWRLRIDALELDLEVQARVEGQELRTLVRYWEGSVAVRGELGGREVTGLGYLEMTGYDGAGR